MTQEQLDRWRGRATQWQIRDRKLEFGSTPLVMGIVNVTPDSFSDGGKFHSRDTAVAQALKLAEEGADILDIGGESTRPYSTPVEVEEELKRVVPVIERLRDTTTIPISIDSSKPAVTRAALDAGASIINDVSGLEDPGMIELALESRAGVCAMHMQGTPQTMQDNPQYSDVVTEILDYLRLRRDALLRAGIEPSRVCLDPGIGFGKTHQHNLTLLASCWRYHELQCPLLVGHSRKGFIARLLGDKELDRTAGTVGVSLSLAMQGVQVLRVHDVRPTREALLLFEASGGITRGVPSPESP